MKIASFEKPPDVFPYSESFAAFENRIHAFCDRYMDHHLTDAEKRAIRCGTYQKADRTEQYPVEGYYQLLDSHNKQWVSVHKLEQERDREKKEIQSLKRQKKSMALVIACLSSIITTLAWKGMELLLK